ncbi:hypothetical protein GG681_02620 [Epibacterium sp. SM1969]|uniref:Uncharacterized protein n=1 Tax=Tritonibacter aquimaris TaxID=2663379 RepID=A0A844AU20_9RHOB|nr:hypothetical protein [Tritonibacter aquimaris]MQY41521.1 hypothetical protein [Tritonibacter aquimaris]
MKSIFLCLAILSLTACNSTAPIGQPVEQRSATAKNLHVPVRNTHLRVQYDPAQTPTIAYLTYVGPVSIADLLSINKEVIPAVQSVTGCRITAAPVADNRLLPSEGRTAVPLQC